MFESFTKPGWQHRNPEVRQAAIDEVEDQAILVELVLTDTDAGVRAHALSRITDPAELDKLADALPQKLPKELQQQARKQRLQQLLPDAGQLQSISDDAVLIRIAGLTDDPEVIAASIGRISDSKVRMDVAASHPVAKARLCAAQGISDTGSLKELMLRARHSDKAVYQHCKEQLDKIHAAEQAEAERRKLIQQLAEDARELCTAVDSPAYKGRYQTLEQRWLSLRTQASPEQQGPIQNDLDTCAKRIEIKEKEQAADQEKQSLRQEAARAFVDIIGELEGIDPKSMTEADSAAIRQLGDRLQEIEDRWLAALHHAQPSSEQTGKCKELLKRWRAVVQTWQQLLARKPALDKIHDAIKEADKSDFMALQKLQGRIKKLIKALPWPDALGPAIPPPVQQLRDQQAQLQEHLGKLKEKEQQTIEKLEAAFEQLRGELETNHFRNADRALNRLRNVLRQLDPEKQQHFHHELKPLVARLGEIHDWQGFAIEPKKIELCERMSALVGSVEDPDILAGQIKTLQKEWKKLGPLSPRRDQALWKQFSAAADEAWQPCKAAFAQQAVLRQENFEQRMALIAQLADYEKRMHWPDTEDPDSDSPQPDWKLVQKTLDTAREAFGNIKPVDRKGERKSRKALKKVCDRIYGHIKLEYGRNIEQKEELISRAKTFVDLEDLHQAIDRTKGIQREWKEVGMTPMKVDRRLWKEFRGACDAVFARLDAQREERNAAMSAQIEEAEGLARQARTLLDSDSDDERLHLKRDLGQLKSALREIELPRNVQQKMNKRFAEMESEARSIVSAIRARQEVETWRRLLDRMTACALKTQDEKKAEKLWQPDGGLPKGIEADGLDAFWQQGPGDSDEDTLREACIALEILIGAESPQEDKEARMAYQMKRLVEGMGSRQAGNEERLPELINEFIALRPPIEWMERFCRGVETTRTGENAS